MLAGVRRMAGMADCLCPHLAVFVDVVSWYVVFFVLAWLHCCIFGWSRRVLGVGDTKVVQNVLACQTQPSSYLRSRNLNIIGLRIAFPDCFLATVLQLSDQQINLQVFTRLGLFFPQLLGFHANWKLLGRLWFIPRFQVVLGNIELIALAILTVQFANFFIDVVGRSGDVSISVPLILWCLLVAGNRLWLIGEVIWSVLDKIWIEIFLNHLSGELYWFVLYYFLL